MLRKSHVQAGEVFVVGSPEEFNHAGAAKPGGVIEGGTRDGIEFSIRRDRSANNTSALPRSGARFSRVQGLDHFQRWFSRKRHAANRFILKALAEPAIPRRKNGPLSIR